jgi:hypothetical protein
VRLCSIAIALFVSLATRPATAAPLWLSLSTSGGILEERALGVARDDFQLTLRLGIGIGRHVAVSIGFDADLERLELAARTGVMVRPFAAPRFAPYLRAEVAIVGATLLGSDWELLGGAGILWRVHRWTALFVEVDAVGRVGAVRSLADHIACGIVVTAPSFWR